MQITEAQESHIPGIVRLWVEFEDYHLGFDRIFTRCEDSEAEFEKYLRKHMEKEDALVLVAVDEGKAVAYALAWIAELPPVFKYRKYGYISDMAVTRAERRKGIGSRMLERVLAWFDGRGVKRIHLGVVGANEPAITFWRSQGFETYTHTLYMERP
jgi:GNAT superfamily N-acetyltransferase